MFRGRSVQTFRDPGFLGIVSPDNDAVYLPLKKGSNDLTLAVSELGGWMGLHLPLGGLEKLALGRGTVTSLIIQHGLVLLGHQHRRRIPNSESSPFQH